MKKSWPPRQCGSPANRTSRTQTLRTSCRFLAFFRRERHEALALAGVLAFAGTVRALALALALASVAAVAGSLRCGPAAAHVRTTRDEKSSGRSGYRHAQYFLAFHGSFSFGCD